MADDHPSRGWRAQLAPGRVFQLKRKTYRGNSVCVLITDVPERWTNYPMCIEVNKNGCVFPGYGDRARSYVGALRPSDFTGRLIVRRRRDLERFDAMDIAMIQHGCPMDFTGRLDRYEWPGTIPSIPGVQWTVFWTRYDSVVSTILPREVKALFYGAWHFTASCEEGYPRRRFKAWATAETDWRKLRTIQHALSRIFPVERGAVRVVARDMGDHYLIVPDGEAGPAISTRWTSAISKATAVETWRVWSHG